MYIVSLRFERDTSIIGIKSSAALIMASVATLQEHQEELDEAYQQDDQAELREQRGAFLGYRISALDANGIVLFNIDKDK